MFASAASTRDWLVVGDPVAADPGEPSNIDRMTA
jgi:hypothetical protein